MTFPDELDALTGFEKYKYSIKSIFMEPES